MATSMKVKRGKTKAETEAADIKLNGATKEEIFYQLPFTLTIGKEKFEIKRKSVMASFPIQRKVNAIVQEVLAGVGEEKIQEMIGENVSLSVEKLIPLLVPNYAMVSNKVDEIIEIFVWHFIEEEDLGRLEDATMEDFDAAFQDIMGIIYPFILRPVKRLMLLAETR